MILRENSVDKNASILILEKLEFKIEDTRYIKLFHDFDEFFIDNDLPMTNC